MKLSLSILLTMSWFSCGIVAQPLFQVKASSLLNPEMPVALLGESGVAEVTDNKDDPAYKIYKIGYNLILDEEWNAARKKFTEVIKQYPKSDYLDDAEYWSSFTLKHTDKKKAIEAYKKFISSYPKSSYYDDAVADYLELTKGRTFGLNDLTVKGNASAYVDDNGIHIAGNGADVQINANGVIVDSDSDNVRMGMGDVLIGGDGKSFSYRYGFGPSMKRMERDLRRTAHQRARMHATPSPLLDGKTPVAIRSRSGENEGQEPDPETRLKMDVLLALGDMKEDEKSFETLKAIAIDLRQPGSLREAALDGLSNFKKFDVQHIYLHVAQTDTSGEIQNYAIDYLSEHGKDKNKTVLTLIDLFNSLPKNRTEQRRTVFYSIAEIGNDRAVDFLSAVARTHDDYDLRSEAVFYLGNIGSEKARSALYEVLKEK